MTSVPNVEHFLIERREEQRALIALLSRPSRKNAVNSQTYNELRHILRFVEDDDSLLSLIITGDGDYFTAGQDLKDIPALDIAREDDEVGRCLRSVIFFKKNLVAAVNGPAIGIGLTILLHCDHVVVSNKATVQAPFPKIGVVPEFGSSYLLPRTLGLARAQDVMWGRVLTSREIEQWGIANTTVGAGQEVAEALRWCERVASHPVALESVLAFKAHLRRDRADIWTTVREELTAIDRRLANGDVATAVGETRAKILQSKL